MSRRDWNRKMKEEMQELGEVVESAVTDQTASNCWEPPKKVKQDSLGENFQQSTRRFHVRIIVRGPRKSGTVVCTAHWSILSPHHWNGRKHSTSSFHCWREWSRSISRFVQQVSHWKVFSTGDSVVNWMSRLKPKKVNELIFLHSWES